jgi:HEAT repeat protein
LRLSGKGEKFRILLEKSVSQRGIEMLSVAVKLVENEGGKRAILILLDAIENDSEPEVAAEAEIALGRLTEDSL